MKNKLRVVLCMLLAVVLSCMLVACTIKDTTNKEPDGGGGNTPGGDPIVPPPVVDTSMTRLTEYVDNTLFYDMAKTETVTATATMPTSEVSYTVYTHEDAVYSKQTVKGEASSSYSKELFSLENITTNDVTTYTLSSVNIAMYFSVSFLASSLLEADDSSTMITANRADTYVKNADKSKTLTHEFEWDVFYIKQVFNFTKEEKLSRIELFSFGKGKICEINFTYSNVKPETPAAVKAVEIPADKLSYGILSARNVAKLLAQGETTKIQNLKYTNNRTDSTEGSLREEELTLITKGTESSSTNTVESGGDVTTTQTYANSSWSYNKKSSTNPAIQPAIAVIPISFITRHNFDTLLSFQLKMALNSLLTGATAEDFIKTTHAETNETIFTYLGYTDGSLNQTMTLKFNKDGRFIMYTNEYVDRKTFTTISTQYEFDDKVEMAQEFKDYQFSANDKAFEKYMEIIKASHGKAQATIGGAKITTDVGTIASIAYDTNLLSTGLEVNRDGEPTHYIYGNAIIDLDLSYLASIQASLFTFSDLSLDHETTFALAENVLTISLHYNGEPRTVTIAFNAATNQITQFTGINAETYAYVFEKVEPITIEQKYIDYILASYSNS